MKRIKRARRTPTQEREQQRYRQPSQEEPSNAELLSPSLFSASLAAGSGPPAANQPGGGQVRRAYVADHSRRLGNQATGQMLQRWQAEAQRAEEADDPITTVTVGLGRDSSTVPSYSTQTNATNPFASRRFRQQPSSDVAAQRAPVSPFASRELLQATHAAGEAPIQRAADAAAGGVSFEVQGFDATIAGGLVVTEDGGGVTLESEDYDVTGTVKATGPKSRVKNWDVGMLQTVYQSSRNFFYNSKARTVSRDLCTTLPVRDGDAGVQPWYGAETVAPFSEADEDTQTSNLFDKPSSNSGWDDPASGEADTLDHTNGRDVFRTWLAVRNRNTFHKLYLRFADWQVNYTTAVDMTQGVGSRVTPDAAAGGKVTGTGNGMGGKQPALFDPVANDVAQVVNGKW